MNALNHLSVLVEMRLVLARGLLEICQLLSESVTSFISNLGRILISHQGRIFYPHHRTHRENSVQWACQFNETEPNSLKKGSAPTTSEGKLMVKERNVAS